jgi:hypothetical protein
MLFGPLKNNPLEVADSVVMRMWKLLNVTQSHTARHTERTPQTTHAVTMLH